VHTAGLPSAIRLSVDRNTINTGSRDVAHLKIEIVDATGYIVPDANNQIQVTVEGAGNLIGLDNGNPADHTSMKSNSRKTFNGLALAVVQSASQSGVIRVKVSSPGLKDSRVELTSQKNNVTIMRVEDLK